MSSGGSAGAHAQSTATIQGKVTSASGDPVEGATVRASVVRFHDGRRRAIDVGLPATTDDHGRYHIDGLAAGRYLVRAIAPPEQPLQQPNPIFPPPFPSQPAERKETLLVAAQTIDLDLTTRPLPTARISGRMLDPSGRPMTASLLIEPSWRSGAVAPQALGATISPDGRFEFANVPPGEYAIQVFRTRPNPSREGAFAGAYVQLAGGDVTGVELKTTVGSTVKGAGGSRSDSLLAGRALARRRTGRPDVRAGWTPRPAAARPGSGACGLDAAGCSRERH